MMKKQYTEPKIEVVLVDETDVITASFLFDLEGIFDEKTDRDWKW